jgi:hypothetical protein
VDERDFVGGGAIYVYGDWSTMTVDYRHDFRAFSALCLSHACSALLGRRENAVNERFPQVKVAFVVERFGEDMEHVFQNSAPNPPLKAPMAGPMRRIAIWQVRPCCACPQDPQDSVEHSAVLFPRAPTTVLAARRHGQEGSNDFPLIVSQVTRTRSCVGHPVRMAPVAILLIGVDEPSIDITASIVANHVKSPLSGAFRRNAPGIYTTLASRSVWAGWMKRIARDINLGRQVAIKISP